MERMRKQKIVLSGWWSVLSGKAMIILFLLITHHSSLTTSLAQMKHEMSTGETKVVDGIKATMRVTPSMSMVDILLSDVTTGKAITKAKVVASIKGPEGKVQEKELVGGKMGEQYSFMNTLDLSRKGRYGFDIIVEAEKKKVMFNFGYEVK